MKVLLLSPFLDAPFKKSAGTHRSGHIIPIRQYWKNFIEGTIQKHRDRGDDVTVIENYQWYFNEMSKDVFKHYDRVYIPHRNSAQYEYHESNARYFHQTVFPWLFTIDSKGWGGTNSKHPFDYHSGKDLGVFENLQKRIAANDSKFDQPMDNHWIPPKGDYIFFPCQIPHDETILFHSDVGVVEALTNICSWANQNKIQVVAKGHPINPGSMEQCQQVTVRFDNVTWVDNCSIHDALSNCKAVYTINSGVGMEALLHEKPVVTFGKSEYDCVTYNATVDTMEGAWDYVNAWDGDKDPSYMLGEYRKFMDCFVGYCVDSSNVRLVD